MRKSRLIRKSDSPQAGWYLAAVALLIFCSPLKAETGQPEQGPAGSSQSAQYQVWIQDPYTSENVLTTVREPDQSLWNGARITDYEESLRLQMPPPLGILTIDKLNINVPIYNGTYELNLNRGAGRVKGMAKMDEVGNLGISSHRDGFFRGLKDIQVGDDIEIQTTRGVQHYSVSDISIIPKEDISPMKPTTDKTLTLVTCYPFYFVGHAPKRYIVTATAEEPLIE